MGVMQNMEKQKPALRHIITAAVFILFIGVFFILNFAVPAPAVLVSERRIPAKFPEFSMDTILDGSFMSRFGDYAADRFVFRDMFRGIHSFIVLDIYQQTDKSGIYRCPDVGLGEYRSTNATAFRQTSERILKAAQSLEEFDLNIYYTVVPDKSTFAARYMPGFDLGTAEVILNDVLSDYTYIRVAEQLDADSFYRTDLHWNQTKIISVTNHLLTSMGANPLTGQLNEVFAGEWRGLYSGQLALPVAADSMSYVDVPGLRVSYLDEKTLELTAGPVYEAERINGVDPYDLFLRGPQPLIVIENDNAPQRELFLFRDSFGSSLAPLLASSYSKITVIDLRYIHLSMLGYFVEFTPGSDALFIYSSQIFNNPSILQT